MNETCSQIRTYSITREINQISSDESKFRLHVLYCIEKSFPLSTFAPVSLIVCDNLVPFHLFRLRYVGTNPSQVSRVPDCSDYIHDATNNDNLNSDCLWYTNTVIVRYLLHHDRIMRTCCKFSFIFPLQPLASVIWLL
jgi:hypothetical protein